MCVRSHSVRKAFVLFCFALFSATAVAALQPWRTQTNGTPARSGSTGTGEMSSLLSGILVNGMSAQINGDKVVGDKISGEVSTARDATIAGGMGMRQQ